MFPEWLHFFRRLYPSANCVLVRGSRPVLVDTGFGGDAEQTIALIKNAGVDPASIALIVNTHYHVDHSGGNSSFQACYGTPVAAHSFDAALINGRDPQACAAEWLDQPIEFYRVDRPLEDGDLIDAGGVLLQVIATPGHTRGHICLYAPEDKVLICGDAVHSDDVAWVNPFTEGEGALEQMMRSVERLASLEVRQACSGHGPPMSDPPAAFAAALERYRRWQSDAERIGWHACKRIFSYHLMLCGGMTMAEIGLYLVERAWFADYSRGIFRCEPADFVEPLVNELLRSGACGWKEGRLVALAPYSPPPPGWPAGPARVRDW